VNSASNPAARGSIVSIFGTGGGLTTQAFGDGQIVPEAATFLAGLSAWFDGGAPTTITYAGAAPFLVNGVMQVNMRIPTYVTPGPAVQFDLVSDPYRSQSGVTVAVK
jgi:uncharacterized protein (TIGR03437 family)